MSSGACLTNVWISEGKAELLTRQGFDGNVLFSTYSQT